jgi:hypothetical protein
MNILRAVLPLFVAFVAVRPSIAVSQEAPVPATQKTQLEQFEGKRGVVLIRGRSAIGEVSRGKDSDRVAVEVMEITDAATGKKLNGILVFVDGYTDADRQRILGALDEFDFKRVPKQPDRQSHQAYIDYEEIDDLIKGIEYIADLPSGVTELDHFDAMYVTTGKLSIRASGKSDTKEIHVTIGFLSGTLPEGYFTAEELKEIKSLIVKAKQKLDTVK